MRRVRAQGTGPERIVRQAVRALRRGYRLGGWGLPGRPDLVFPGARRVIFVHGCFWHGHDCPRGARAPRSNAAYWAAKIARNRDRDARALAALASTGWKTLVLWECSLRDQEALAIVLAAFLGIAEPSCAVQEEVC